MDRQQRALDGQFHDGPERDSHVDAGPQICGAVVGLDDCGLGMLCPLYLQGAVFHFSFVWSVCDRRFLRVEKMAFIDENRITN